MNDFWDSIKKNKLSYSEIRELIERSHGKRGLKAIKTIEERRVKQYKDFFVVVGYHDEYIVDEDFCTCRDFLFRERECSHILAVKIAQLTGQYEKYSSWYYSNLKL